MRYFDVDDRKTDGNGSSERGAFLGGTYLDLFPRDGKYSHAAAFGVGAASVQAARKPVSVLLTSFNPKGLNHDELETLLHEFGHVLHGVLSTARYADQAGTAVKRDFVEAPSQMFEEWARRQETLAVLAELCSTCPRLSADQLKQLDAARTFGRGIRYARQWALAAHDMQLHTGAPKPAMATWAALERTTPLGHADGSLLPANFGHLFGGYAAGHYGYMWREVMGLDMLSAFDGQVDGPGGRPPLPGPVANVTVTLTGVSHTVASDIGAILVGPSGASVAFFNGAGGIDRRVGPLPRCRRCLE